MTELFGQYTGITVLSYQLDPDELRHLVLRPDLWIIHISRHYLLQTAVSDRIAKQTRLWNRWDAYPDRQLNRYFGALDPLDIDDACHPPTNPRSTPISVPRPRDSVAGNIRSPAERG